MKTTKRIISVLLLLITMLSIMPTMALTAQAAEVSETNYEIITVDSWDALDSALRSSNNYHIKLSNDIKHKIDRGVQLDDYKYIKVNDNKILDLNGYTIEVDDQSNAENDDETWLYYGYGLRTLFEIAEDAELTVEDSGGSGTILFKGDMIGVNLHAGIFRDIEDYDIYARRDIFENHGTLTINGGSFSAGHTKKQYIHNYAYNAHQIVIGSVVDNFGSLTINGGNLLGHSAKLEGGNSGFARYYGFAATIENKTSGRAVINGGMIGMVGCGHIFDYANTLSLTIYGGDFYSKTFDHIRTLNDHDNNFPQLNHVEDGFIPGYNIVESAWKHGGTKVYINKVDVTDKIDQYDFVSYADDKMVTFESKVIEGSIQYTSGALAGKSMSFNLTGGFKKLQQEGKELDYQWQVYDKKNGWKNIEGANVSQYTLPSTLVGKEIRLKVSSPEYAGFAVGQSVEVVKQTNYEEPHYPALIVDYANRQITIRVYSSYKSTQEYVITTSSDVPTEDQWENKWETLSSKPNSSGSFTNLTAGKTYYVHTRFKETDTSYAGNVVYTTKAEMSEKVYLAGIKLRSSTTTGRYANAGEYICVNVTPVPYNTTDWEGILGSNWHTNDNAKIYANSKGQALDPNKYYTSVYVKADTKETVTVNAEVTIGYNNIVRDSMTFDFCDSNGQYSFTKTQTSFDPNTITVGRGSTATTRIYSDLTPDKPIHVVTFAHDSYTDLSGVTIERIGDSNEILITASEDATLGKGGYRPTVNGDAMENCLYINVVEENIPVDLVEINTMAKKIKSGETYTLSATITPSNATDKKITWTSSDSSIAKINSNGVVTGVKDGTATITAKAGDKTATCKIVVDNTLNTHLVYVERGAASKDSAKAGETITITADDLGASAVFKGWNTEDVTLASTTSKTTTFTMPDHEVSITAVYKECEHRWNSGNVTKAATTSASGTKTYTCKACSTTKKETIAKVSSVKLSATEYTYNGYVKKPTVTVKDVNGNKLESGVDYTVSYASGRKLPGKYKVTVTFKGEYSGTKSLYFTITPKAPAKFTVASRSTSTIKLSWPKAEGVTGYRIYRYDSSTKTYKTVATTTKLSYTVKNLKSATNYTFRIKSYKKLSDGTTLWSGYRSLTTATRPVAPLINSLTSSSKGKVTLKWTNVARESGYQIYYSTSKTGTYKLLDTTKVNDVSETCGGLKSGRTYYFKVRAYKTVNGNKVYSSFSAVKGRKIK